MDLQRNGFVDHLREANDDGPPARARSTPVAFQPAEVDPELAARWTAFGDLPAETLGHCVWEMYDSRGFGLPATPGGADFAWLATLIGLFETGYISNAGLFDRDMRERNIRGPRDAPADR